MFLPARWRETDEAPAIRARITAAEQAGLQVLVERHRFECLADTSLPDDVPPLSFRSAPVDDTVLVDLLGRIGHGSLDAGTVRSVSQLGASGAAQVYLTDMDALPGDRRSWLLASDDEGQIVGVAIASTETSPYPLVAFVGVDPRHRGQDYGRALLVETTRRVLAAGAERVRADTDMSNAPMVSVFSRAGWQPWATRLVMQVAPT
jgi:GNAT superfamily N-acetyltransferase